MMSTADKLEGMHPSRKNDMLQLFYVISIVIHKLPYYDFYFTNAGTIPKEVLKASLLVWKRNCTATEYCKSPILMFMQPYLEEVLSMSYGDEPNYSKLKFLLVKSLLDRNLAPSKNVLCSSLLPNQQTVTINNIALDESNHIPE